MQQAHQCKLIMHAQQIRTQIVSEAKRRMIESVNRIRKCLGLLTEEEIWRRPNEHTVSVGNLVLHLCGNARQWILSGLGGRADHRERDREFAVPGPVDTAKLLQDMDALMDEIDQVLQQLTSEALVTGRSVQGFEETGIGIILHVVEHFSYHTGQIVYYTKVTKNIDLGLYQGINLNQTASRSDQV